MESHGSLFDGKLVDEDAIRGSARGSTRGKEPVLRFAMIATPAK